MEYKSIKSFFEYNLRKYGLYSPHSLAWTSLESQIIRFQVLTKISHSLNNQSILDVGSGLGDFYHFLTKNFKNVNYTGCELSEEICSQSKVKYPHIEIICDDFLEHEFDKKFDYVFCSGALNIEVPNHKNYIQTAIRKMWDLSIKGIAFNLPSNYSELSKENPAVIAGPNEVKLAYADPCEIFDFCKKLTSKVTLRHDYLPHDFTLYCYR